VINFAKQALLFYIKRQPPELRLRLWEWLDGDANAIYQLIEAAAMGLETNPMKSGQVWIERDPRHVRRRKILHLLPTTPLTVVYQKLEFDDDPPYKYKMRIDLFEKKHIPENAFRKVKG
jgi:hypothetical protein